jgi:hypothetical protein
MTTLERADTLCRIRGVTCASCACSVVGLGELLRRAALRRTALRRRLLLGSAAAAAGRLAAMVPEQHGGGTRADARNHGHDHGGDEPATSPPGKR